LSEKAKKLTAGLGVAAVLALLLAIVAQRYQLAAMADRQLVLEERLAEVEADASSALLASGAQVAAHVRELDGLRGDVRRCQEGLAAVAQSLEAVANSCPGRAWPPSWDRIRNLAGID